MMDGSIETFADRIVLKIPHAVMLLFDKPVDYPCQNVENIHILVF